MAREVQDVRGYLAARPRTPLATCAPSSDVELLLVLFALVHNVLGHPFGLTTEVDAEPFDASTNFLGSM